MYLIKRNRLTGARLRRYTGWYRWRADFVLSPADPIYAAANQMGAPRQVIRTISNGLPVWDCVDDPPLERLMFLDPSLNRQGVAAFMDSLRRKRFFQVAGGLGDREASRRP